jgi:hypothetical protein
MNNQNIPKKGDIIINPNTQRPVRVGGRTWLGLVKKGLVEGRYTDPKELKQNYDENVDEDIKRINETLPRGQQAVRGRGKYKNKIVSRNVKPPIEDVSRYTAQMASRVVNENIESLADCDDMEAELERLIMQEMTMQKPKQSKPRGRPTKVQTQQYELKEPEQYDEEDPEEIDYFQDEEYSE